MNQWGTRRRYHRIHCMVLMPELHVIILFGPLIWRQFIYYITLHLWRYERKIQYRTDRISIFTGNRKGKVSKTILENITIHLFERKSMSLFENKGDAPNVTRFRSLWHPLMLYSHSVILSTCLSLKWISAVVSLLRNWHFCPKNACTKNYK